MFDAYLEPKLDLMAEALIKRQALRRFYVRTQLKHVIP